MRNFYPRLRLNEIICKENISRISFRASQSGASFRPHFKTHQSAEIGEWFHKAGVNKITVSSLKMALYFAAAGWEDIFIAFPVNLLEVEEFNLLASRINLSLSVDSAEVATGLVTKMDHHAGVYIKIDTGYQRSGVPASDTHCTDGILKAIKRAEKLHFKGFYTHSGHTYHASNREEIKAIYEDAVTKLNGLKQTYLDQFPELILSVGDTPSSSILTNYGDVDEVRPGNFIFYDLMQVDLGACQEKNIASVLECPVVSKSESRNEVVIHGGAVHLSKERLPYKGFEIYGKIVLLNEAKWGESIPDTFLKSLSQEHGIIQTTAQHIKLFNIGQTVGILPIHSCLTANLSDRYLTMKGQIIEKMRS